MYVCVRGCVCVFQQHPNATNSSETSVGGVSGACGSSGIPAPGEAGCSSRGGSSSGAGGGGGGGGSGSGGGLTGPSGCEQAHRGPSSHSTRESHAKFRHGLLQLMIHTIDPLHDGQSRAGIPTPHSITLACGLPFFLFSLARWFPLPFLSLFLFLCFIYSFSFSRYAHVHVRVYVRCVPS